MDEEKKWTIEDFEADEIEDGNKPDNSLHLFANRANGIIRSMMVADVRVNKEKHAVLVNCEARYDIGVILRDCIEAIADRDSDVGPDKTMMTILWDAPVGAPRSMDVYTKEGSRIHFFNTLVYKDKLLAIAPEISYRHVGWAILRDDPSKVMEATKAAIEHIKSKPELYSKVIADIDETWLKVGHEMGTLAAAAVVNKGYLPEDASKQEVTDRYVKAIIEMGRRYGCKSMQIDLDSDTKGITLPL